MANDKSPNDNTGGDDDAVQNLAPTTRVQQTGRNATYRDVESCSWGRAVRLTFGL